jgi:hypothetical protein
MNHRNITIDLSNLNINVGDTGYLFRQYLVIIVNILSPYVEKWTISSLVQ